MHRGGLRHTAERQEEHTEADQLENLHLERPLVLAMAVSVNRASNAASTQTVL